MRFSRGSLYLGGGEERVLYHSMWVLTLPKHSQKTSCTVTLICPCIFEPNSECLYNYLAFVQTTHKRSSCPEAYTGSQPRC